MVRTFRGVSESERKKKKKKKKLENVKKTSTFMKIFA